MPHVLHPEYATEHVQGGGHGLFFNQASKNLLRVLQATLGLLEDSVSLYIGFSLQKTANADQSGTSINVAAAQCVFHTGSRLYPF